MNAFSVIARPSVGALLMLPVMWLLAPHAVWAATAQTPWQTNAYGTQTTNIAWNYAMGYHFTPLVNGQVTGVGGYFNGTKTVKLFNKATGTLLATATVTAANTWAYTPITPVNVTAGTTYTIAVYLAGAGGSYRNGLSPALPRTFGDIRIEGTTYASTSTTPAAVPTNTLTTVMYGQADIQFVPATTDTTPPTVTMTLPPAGGVAGTISVTATASDNVGVVGVQFKLDGSNLGLEDTLSPYSVSWNTTTATNAGHTLTAVARDAVGNSTTSAPVTVTVNNVPTDTTPPTVSLTSPTGGTVSGIITVSATASDNVGVSYVELYLDGVVLGGNDSSSYSITWDTRTATNAVHTLTAMAIDTSNNRTTSGPVVVTVSNAPADTTPPTGAVSINSAAAVTKTIAVTLTLSATDNSGTVSQMQFSNDGATYSTPETYATAKAWTLPSSDGTKTVYAKFKDAAGNWSTAATDTIILDTVAPTGTISINAAAAMTNTTAVTLTLSASDATSGVAQMQFSNDNVTYSTPEAYATTKTWTLSAGDGTKTVYAKFKDAAGNWSAAVTDTIVLDTLPPTISVLSASGITTTAASVTWTTNEVATSQVEYGPTISYGQTTLLDTTLVTSHSVSVSGLTAATLYHYRVRSTDAAGNEAMSVDATFMTAAPADTIPPTGSITINGGATGTNNPSVTLTLSATDNSGTVNQMQCSNDGTTYSTPETYATTKTWTLTTGDGTKTVYAKFKDAAGNWSSAVSDTIVLDTTPPILGFISPKDRDVLIAPSP